MSKFLTPFARQLRQLNLDGITWRRDGGVEEVRSRFIPLIISSDSEARYEILGMMRLNAYMGCTFCYAQTQRVGDRNQYAIYRYYDDPDNPGNFAADRTDTDIRRDANLAMQPGQPVNGVRCRSALTIVPGTDLRKSQSTEQLHLLWERNFVRIYEILTDPEMDDYITPRNLKTISDRILIMKPPTKLARQPRPLEHFKKFKGTEYRNLAWYYWLPCAHDYMTPAQIEYFALFAEASYVLNKDSINVKELHHVEQNIDRFRRDSGTNFPERLQTYNLHVLKHIVRCVRELGPLWVASGFWFESLNRQIKNYITSPTDRAMQIACRILLDQMVEKCLDWELSPAILNLLRELLCKARWIVLPNNATGRFTHYLKGVAGVLDEEDIAALKEAGYGDIDEEMQITRYQQVVIDGVVYQPPSDRTVKYDNSVVHVTPPHGGNSMHFIRIKSILRWQHGDGRMNGVIGYRFNTVGAAFNTTYMKIVEESQDLIYLPVRCINAPAVLVKSLETIYISPIPNKWDVD